MSKEVMTVESHFEKVEEYKDKIDQLESKLKKMDDELKAEHKRGFDDGVKYLRKLN